MTNAEHTPVLSRFPWIQLVFCIVCFSMGAWTWIRYSYCWGMSVERFVTAPPPSGMLIEVRGRAQTPGLPHQLEPVLNLALQLEAGYSSIVAFDICEQGSDSDSRIRAFADPASVSDLHGRTMFRGSVCHMRSDRGRLGPPVLAMVDGNISHRSVAGLVVAAFGGFVFALYLRRWLLERKAHKETGSNAEA